MNVLVIAPHPDDESIGCGGAVCLHVKRGDRVAAVFLTSGELGLKQFARKEAWKIREGEAREAAKILGVSELLFLRKRDWFLNEQIQESATALRPILQAQAPQLVYFPHEREWHPDHKAALPILRMALKHSGLTPKLRAYEIWTPLAEFDQVENISAMMPRKLRAIRSHRSQLNEFPYDRAIVGLNQYRGVMAAKARFAEVFMSVSGTARS
jgi:LmbE family N-acetylglucosaminyl deacetylase